MLPYQYFNERKRQIDTLKIFNDKVTEIKEDVEYMVEFDASNHKMHLRVILLPDFPASRPVIYLSQHVTHPWLDESTEVIGAPGLINFSTHSDLGRVVRAIIREFQGSLPKILENEQVTNGLQLKDGSLPPSELNAFTDLKTPRAPLMSPTMENDKGASDFPQLLLLSDEELQDLYYNPDMQDDFLNQINTSWRDEQRQLLDTVEKQALENKQMKENIFILKDELKRDVERLSEITTRYEKALMKRNLLCEEKPRQICLDLLEKARSLDASTEAIAEEFLSGKISLDEFLNKYIEFRTKAVKMKVKYDILSDQLNGIKVSTN